jgi:surface antigen
MRPHPKGLAVMFRSPKTSRLLLAITIAFSSATGTIAVATPAYAVPTADIIATAKDEVGTREGSARADSYGAAVGLYDSTHNFAWCAAFVSWLMESTGATSYRSASVGDWIAVADANTYGLSVTDTPQAGDLVAFDWDGNGDYAYPNRHIGLVKSVGMDGSFTTIEGNTGLPSGVDGVARKTRSTVDGYSTLFIRIDVGSSSARTPTAINSDPSRDGTG